MGLPLYLAMTAAEIAACPTLPRHWCCMFAEDQNDLPPEAVLILTDRAPERITDRLIVSIKALRPRGVLLDFEHPPTEHVRAIVRALAEALPCPVAAAPEFAEDTPCAVFLPPCPLHVPLRDYLRPWRGREVWLDSTLQQQAITVTKAGTTYGPASPADRRGGIWDESLCCQVVTEAEEESVRFTLFDTPDTFANKLTLAEELGVSAAVGLWQELKTIA